MSIKYKIKHVSQVLSMNSKKQMQILPEMDLGSQHAAKMELSVKKLTDLIIA